MEGSRSKIEVLKPVILKAGIPLVMSVSGLIWAKIIARKRSSRLRLCLAPSQDDDSFRSKYSEALKEDDEGNCERSSLEEEVLSLRRLVEIVQEKEGKLEMQFLRFCELKDRETVIMEMGTMLKMEMSRVETMNTEATLIEYSKALEKMESENRVLKRKVTKLCRIVKQQSSLIRENKERIAAQERKAKMSVEDENRDLKKIEDDIRELRRSLEEMMNLEKCEIWDKMSLVEESVSKIEEEALSMEEYRHLQKEGAGKNEDLIIPRRRGNACLRTELQMKQDEEHKGNYLQLAVAEDQDGHDECSHELNVLLSPVYTSTSSSPGIRDGGCHMETKKKKKFLQKLRKWVEGRERNRVMMGEKN